MNHLKNGWIWKITGLIMTICIIWGTGIQVDAEEYDGKIITGMDMEGNVYEVEVENGTVEYGIENYVSGEGGYIVNFNTNGNSVTEYREENTRIEGYTNGAYGADALYLGSYGGSVRFLLAGVVGWVDASKVQILNVSSVNSVSYYMVSGGRLYHYITANVNYNNYQSQLDNGPAPSYLIEGQKYYSYDGHYFYEQNNFEMMMKDYQNFKESHLGHAVNAGSPFYNYFQYLPLRSTTNYLQPELNNMINSKI